MRRGLSAPLALFGALVGCASASPPPGGPEDHAPPQLVRVTPDTNAVNVRERDVSFYFDETINDRGSGAQEVGNFFLVSPSDGEPHVSWHRSRIDVRPRNGFRPNTAYSVTLLPGLSDLRNNVMRAGRSIVFSTGPTIPTERINGIIFDWVAERPVARALLQAVTPDSVMYLAQADSLGRFTIGPLPAGSYLVRGIVDQNGNRALDRSEAFDTVRVTVPQRAPLELLAVQRDTLPPRITTVTPADSQSVRVTFDRFLDPAQRLAPADFRLVASDSSPIPISSVLDPREEQRQQREAQQVVADSIRRADSVAGRPLVPRRPATTPAARGTSGTLATPSVPPPYTTLLLKLGKPLAPNTIYRVSVSSARALSGRAQGSERTFTTPRAAPPKPAADSARAPTAPTAPKRP